MWGLRPPSPFWPLPRYFFASTSGTPQQGQAQGAVRRCQKVDQHNIEGAYILDNIHTRLRRSAFNIEENSTSVRSRTLNTPCVLALVLKLCPRPLLAAQAYLLPVDVVLALRDDLRAHD